MGDVVFKAVFSADTEDSREALGETAARREFAEKLIKKGWNGEEIAETTGLDATAVNALFAEAAPQG